MDQLGYRCKGCFDKEQEIQRIKGLSVAMNSDLKSLLTSRDAEIERAREIQEALERVLFLIDAAGLLNLTNGVQLGATSWYIKMKVIIP